MGAQAVKGCDMEKGVMRQSGSGSEHDELDFSVWGNLGVSGGRKGRNLGVWGEWGGNKGRR